MIYRTTRVCVVCLTAALCLLQGKAGLAGAYRVIALTGDPAPMSDRVFQSFGNGVPSNTFGAADGRDAAWRFPGERIRC